MDDVLKYGNLTVLNTLESVPQDEWETPNVCGIWSVKNIVAHLASYELLLTDIFMGLIDPEADKPLFAEYAAGDFNDKQVDQRASMTPKTILQEYRDGYDAAIVLLDRIPLETRSQPGTIPWYGKEYSLDDLIVYMYYAHKREHMAEVNVFKDVAKRAAGS